MRKTCRTERARIASSLSSLLALWLSWLLPAGCDPSGVQPPRGSVSFTVTAPASPSTKSTSYAAGALPSDVPLALMPYVCASSGASPSAWSAYPAGRPSPVKALYDGTRTDAGGASWSGKWVPVPEARLLWPGSGFIRFFAFAPWGLAGVTEASPSGGGGPSLSYTVPEAVSAQADLLVADAASVREYNGDPGWRSIDVPLRLAHALTGVRFRIIDGLAVSALSVSGVYGAGTLDLTDASAWSPSGGAAASYVVADGTAAHPALSPGSGLHADTDYALAGYNIVDEALVLLLLPQALPSGASVAATVTLADGSGTPRTITADLSGQEWKPGTMVTYTITRRGPAVPADLDVNLLEEVLWSDEVGVAAWDEVLWDRQRVLAPDIERVHWH